MSRTDNTRPWKARPEQYREWHDHRDGKCDLPTLEQYLDAPRRSRWRTRCTWGIKWHSIRDTRCSCEGCRQHTERKREIKKLRQDRSYLQEAS